MASRGRIRREPAKAACRASSGAAAARGVWGPGWAKAALPTVNAAAQAIHTIQHTLGAEETAGSDRMPLADARERSRGTRTGGWNGGPKSAVLSLT